MRLFEQWAGSGAAVLLGMAMIALPSASAHASEKEERQRELLRLAKQYEYERVYALGDRYGWTYANDPEVLMAYSESLAETARTIPDALRVPKVHKSIALFVEAYADLIKGHVNRAETTFLSLARSGDAKHLGYIGLLELSVTLRDFPAMSEWLAAFRNEPGLEQQFRWIVPSYTANYLAGLGKYGELTQFLDRQEVARTLPTEEMAIWRAVIVKRYNDFSTAHSAIDSAIAKGGLSAALVNTKAMLISSERGSQAGREYLKASQELIPRAWPVEFHRVVYEVDGGLISPEQAVDALVDIAKRRQHDAAAVLVVASTLEGLRASVASIYVVNTLPLPIEDLLRFASYQILLAKSHFNAGDTHSMNVAIERAQRMDPANPELLWLEYEIALTRKDYEPALKALSKLLNLDPYDKPALKAAMHVYEEMGRWDDVIEAGERFLQSRRVVSSRSETEVRERIRRATNIAREARK